MGNKDKILSFLTNNRLTTKELADKTGLKQNEVSVYIQRLMEDGKIKKLDTKDGRYCLYTALSTTDEKSLLKELYLIMTKRMTPKEPLDPNDIEIVRQVINVI
ncbi:MAG: winged helix-turn-helix domain-containing protein [Promethearchaeota archaeon]